MRRLLLVLLIAACGQRAEQRQIRAATAIPPPSTASSQIAVTTPSGDAVVEIAQRGSNLTVTYTENGARHVLQGRVRDSGKRKYDAATGGVVLEVKPSDGGFKVRTPDGTLLWKIKRGEDKIKISDNEENRNPAELKLKDGKVKVYDPAEHLLGEAKFYGDKQRIGIKDAEGRAVYRASGTRAEPFHGVPLIERIPPRERAVIMAELAAPLR